MFDSFFDIFNIVTAVIALASAIAIITPTKKDDKFLAGIKPVIKAFSLQFGQAKTDNK